MKNKKNFIKDSWKILHSMKLGIILLLSIGILSIVGTVIPQGNPLKFYETNYGTMMYKFISTFTLYKVYTSWWFISLVGLLSINLLLCSIIRFKKVVKLAFEKSQVESELKALEGWQEISLNTDGVEKVFEKMKFKNIHKVESNGGTLYYQEKHKLAYLGSWLTHLGLLLIILFFVYGKVRGFEAFVRGIPGTVSQVEGSNLSIQIDDFDIQFRDDFSVEQYISKINVLEGKKVLDSGQVLVNHPLRTNNLNIYQNGTGWAVKAKLYKNGEEYKSKDLYQGSFFIEDNQKIALQFVNFYPDFDETTEELRTKTPLVKHPVMLYALFYDGYRVDMNLLHMGDDIEYKEYRFSIDEPQMFTILQIVKDPGTLGAAIGGGVLVVGIFLAMFLNPSILRIYVYDQVKVKINGRSHKNNILFQEELQEALDSTRREYKWI